MEEQGNPLVPKDNSLVGQDKNLVPQDASATGKKKPAKPRKKPNKENYAYDNRVKLYPDGKYHWIYELHLFKNPAVILEVVRALAITVGIVAILMLVLVTCEDGINIESTQTIRRGAPADGKVEKCGQENQLADGAGRIAVAQAHSSGRWNACREQDLDDL